MIVNRLDCEYRVKIEDWQNLPYEKAVLLRIVLTDMVRHCNEETSACKDHWSPEDPTHGHCAVFALLVQDFFGGELLRADLTGLPRYAHMRSHYWNRLPDGIEVDFSSDQFRRGEDRKLVPEGQVRIREYVLSNPDTLSRYQMLKERLAQPALV